MSSYSLWEKAVRASRVLPLDLPWTDEEFASTPYLRLVPGQKMIRIITAHPKRDKASSDVELLMLPYAITECPEYTALSYCWGGEVDERVVFINGHVVSVRRNLFDFLRFWQELAEMEYAFLWVDALCINQHDPDEKSTEIRRMDMIYGLATTVLVWLGPSVAVDFDLDKFISIVEHKPAEDNPDLVHMRKLAEEVFHQPYFSRAWCTQELAMGRDVRIILGKRRIDWGSAGLLASLTSAHSELRWGKDGEIANNISKMSNEQFCELWAFQAQSPQSRLWIIKRLQHRRAEKKWPSMLSLLVATIACTATYPHDMIYSLWSLASDSQTLVPQIDYNKSPAQVFTDFTLAWIRRYKSLDILGAVEFLVGRVPLLPTWVPDWYGPRLLRPVFSTWSDFRGSYTNDVVDIEHQKLYAASATVPPLILRADGNISNDEYPSLVAGGLSCGRISFVGATHVPGEIQGIVNLWIQDVLQFCENNAGDVEIAQHADESVKDLLDALILGRHYRGLERMRDANEVFTVISEKDFSAVTISETMDHKTRIAWSNHMEAAISGRQLVITDGGHVGLVSSAVEVGDEVAVVFGCCVPLLFKFMSSPNMTIILSDGYFRRMMDGQMIETAGGIEHLIHELGIGETPKSHIELVMDLFNSQDEEDRASIRKRLVSSSTDPLDYDLASQVEKTLLPNTQWVEIDFGSDFNVHLEQNPVLSEKERVIPQYFALQ